MVEPKRPTQRYIERRVAFHESAVMFYGSNGEKQLEAWAREQAALWRAKLEPVAVRDSGDGE